MNEGVKSRAKWSWGEIIASAAAGEQLKSNILHFCGKPDWTECMAAVRVHVLTTETGKICSDDAHTHQPHLPCSWCKYSPDAFA